MSITARPLFEASQAPAAAATQYTVPSTTRTIIDKFTATNTSAGAVALTVYIVASLGAPAAGNTIISAKSLAAGETYTCPEMVSQILSAGGFISLFASAAGSITVRASGRELT